MRKLSLGGIDFSLHREYFAKPIRQVLKDLANKSKQQNVQLPFTFSMANVNGQDARAYLGMIAKFLVGHPHVPMSIGNILRLIEKDERFRMKHRWPRLQGKKPTDKAMKRVQLCPDEYYCMDLLERLFDYGKFSRGEGWLYESETMTLRSCDIKVESSDEKGWDAYRFIDAVREVNKLTYCPYCNAEPVYSFFMPGEEPDRARSDLDHFMPKWLFPYLAISPSNLVPACARCNAKMKGSDLPLVFGARGRISLAMAHPYLNDVHNHSQFAFEKVTSRLFNGRATKGQLALSCTCHQTKEGRLAEASVRRFCLSKVYQEIYTRELREAPIRIRIGRSSYLQFLADYLNRHVTSATIQMKPISSGRFRRLILNCSLNEERIPDERLAKLMIDIDRQLNPLC